MEAPGTPVYLINQTYPSTTDCDIKSVLADDSLDDECDTEEESLSQDGDGAWSSEGLNPFVHRLHVDSVFHLAKIYILTVLLVPLRLLGAIVSLLITWVFACMTLYGLTLEDVQHTPFTGWRKIGQQAVANSMRLTYAWLSFHHVKFKGKQASPKEAPILVLAPHSSFADTLALVVTGPASVVAKGETAGLPILGKIVTAAQPIFVERDDPNSRQTTIQEIILRAKSSDDWKQVAIFVEGTCTNRTALIKFKLGAFHPGVPVQPVLLKYPDKFDTFTWTWDGPGVLKLIWLTLAKFYSGFELEFLPVYTPNEEEKANPKLFAENVQNVMARALGVPVSDYVYEDCIMMSRAKKMQVPFPGDIVQIERCLHKLNLLESEKSKEIALSYCSLPGEDFIDFATFADLLNIDLTNANLCELFRILDHHKCGTISLRNYLLCLFYCQMRDERLIDFLSIIVHLYTPSSQSIPRECFKKIVRHSAKLNEEKSDALFIRIDHTNRGTISFDQFQGFTKDKLEYAFLYKKQELIKRPYN